MKKKNPNWVFFWQTGKKQQGPGNKRAIIGPYEIWFIFKFHFIFPQILFILIEFCEILLFFYHQRACAAHCFVLALDCKWSVCVSTRFPTNIMLTKCANSTSPDAQKSVGNCFHFVVSNEFCWAFCKVAASICRHCLGCRRAYRWFHTLVTPPRNDLPG